MHVLSDDSDYEPNARIRHLMETGISSSRESLEKHVFRLKSMSFA